MNVKQDMGLSAIVSGNVRMLEKSDDASVRLTLQRPYAFPCILGEVTLESGAAVTGGISCPVFNSICFLII